jgi:hypothetical protein
MPMTVHVEEGAARVAADQRAVGLEEGLADFLHPAHADDRMAVLLVAARMADRQAPGARLQSRGVGHLTKGIIARVGDLHHAAVDAVVGAERFAVHDLAVGQDDLALAVRLAGDVTGGEDEAVLADDDATPLRRPDQHAHRAGHRLLEKALDVGLDRLQVLAVLGYRLLEDAWERGGVVFCRIGPRRCAVNQDPQSQKQP